MTVANALDWLSRGMTLRDFIHDSLPLVLAGWGVLLALGRRYLLPWSQRVVSKAGNAIRFTPCRAYRKRRFVSRMRQIRRFDGNPRLLIAYVARRAVGVGIIGSSILLSHALFAADHIKMISGEATDSLRWEIGTTALVEWLFVTIFVFVGADTVERVEDWADPASGRSRLIAQLRGKPRP